MKKIMIALGIVLLPSWALAQPVTTKPFINNLALSACASGVPILGGGSGSAPACGTRSGNTTEVATVTGSLTTNNCIKADVNGNFVDAGTTCGGTGSPGGADTQVQINNSGAFAGYAGFTFDKTSKVTLGQAGTSVGALAFANATSGTISLTPPTGALGTVTLSLPDATDTIIGKATTDILTNKTYDTAGTGNSFKINGTAITAVTGTGSAVLAASPTLSGTVAGNLTWSGTQQFNTVTGFGTAPTASMVTILGAASQVAFKMLGATGTGVSFGEYIGAGTNSTDWAWLVQNQAQTVNYAQIWGDGGITIGNTPTGGNKGLGTINLAADIYKNNGAYTNPDYALEKYFTGSIVKFADKPGAKDYKGLIPLNQLKPYLKANLRLNGIDDDPAGAFRRSDVLLEKVEEATIYITQLHDRVAALEAEIRKLKGKRYAK